MQSSNLKNFSYNDLSTATRNFRPDSVLGEGGFGCVYKGWIDEQTYAPTKPGSGIVIAVKRLNQEGFQGHREWLVIFSSILLSHCMRESGILLIYVKLLMMFVVKVQSETTSLLLTRVWLYTSDPQLVVNLVY